MFRDVNETQEVELSRDPLPLRGRVAVVTGVSRRNGIGYATARRLAAYGASLLLHHFQPHDRAQEWGADDLDAVLFDWAGWENFEERHVAGSIDPVVLDALRKAAP